MGNQKVYDIVTKKILENIEKGVLPWQRPWSLSGSPMNLITRKPYRGFNVFSLMYTDFSSPYWMTFKQAKYLGGTVKKGEKASMVVYWNFKKFDEEDDKGDTASKTIPMVRFYQVFNAEQTEGVEYPKIDLSKRLPLNAEATAALEAYLSREGVTLKHGGDAAYYSPAKDLIKLPPEGQFRSPEHYHATLFHEAGHSTGIEKRLKRRLEGQTNHFGDERYSKEELVAEFCASFLCAEFDLFNQSIMETSATYIKGWGSKIKDHPGMLISAANQGQKAAEFIMNRKHEAAKEEVQDE